MIEAVQNMLIEAQERGRTILTEIESKAVLEAYGIRTNGGRLAANPEAAVAAARALGYPVAMKIVSPAISHKSDAGGVLLDLASDGDVRRAFGEMTGAARSRHPAADVQGVCVQPMVRRGAGETAVGAVFSPQFGHAVMFGLGGLFVEVMQDVAFRIAPVTKEEAGQMIGEIKGISVLHGIRGGRPADVAALAGLVSRLSVLVTEHPEILEVDLNPVIAGYEGQGAVVVDARMILGKPQRVARSLYASGEIVAGLKRIFSPGSIAVIGASGDPSKLGYATVKNIIDGGFPGRIYPINPKADEILGRKCYRDIMDIPGPVDVAVVVIPAKSVADAVTTLGKKGVAGAVVISSGFAEIGNTALQEELSSRALEAKVRILGPNIFGFYYSPAALCATFCTPYTERGTTALSCQSGGVGMAIIGYSRSHGMGISAIVGVGNKCDLDEDDLVEFFGDDPNTEVIAMHVEDIKDGEGFMRTAAKVSRHKPIVVLKAGATPAGERAAFSHTGAIAGDDRIYRAAFAKAGVVQVGNLEQLLDCARCFSKLPVPKGENVLIVTGAGGLGVLLADACTRHGLTLMALEKDQDEAFRAFIPPFGATGNPIDITGGEPPSTYEATIRLALEDDRIDALILGYWHTLITPPQIFAETVIRAKEAAELHRERKPIVAALSGDVEVEAAARCLEEHGVPSFPYASERPVAVLGALYRWARMAGRLR